ncbi:hypothetical protein Sjap_023639 [Stephania japonica]|uniref:Uncharacterized protein n=1 Tax=Stephania japonica TaxID=461633 RepID=A0AAP0HMW8_9MAGN
MKLIAIADDENDQTLSTTIEQGVQALRTSTTSMERPFEEFITELRRTLLQRQAPLHMVSLDTKPKVEKEVYPPMCHAVETPWDFTPGDVSTAYGAHFSRSGWRRGVITLDSALAV